MDAITFIEERTRMCRMHPGCPGCPAFRGVDACIFSANSSATSSEQVELLEEWSDAHPRKTRQSVFLEQYPEAQMGVDGVLDVCPAPIFNSYRLDGGGCREVHKKCVDCRREFWLQGIE